MKQRESVRFEPLKTGDFVKIKETSKVGNNEGMRYIQEQLGEPPYVVLDKAGFTSEFGVEVFIRSSDQRKHPLKLHTSPIQGDDATPVFERGVVQVPMRFLEKVPPPSPEYLVGRIVRLKLDVLARDLPSFRYEAIKGKFGNKECKVLRIIETQIVNDPTQVHYFAMIALSDSTDTDSIHAVPVEGLETVH